MSRQACARKANLTDDARLRHLFKREASTHFLCVAEVIPLSAVAGVRIRQRERTCCHPAEHDFALVVVRVRVARAAAVDVGHAHCTRCRIARECVDVDSVGQLELFEGLEDGALGEAVAVDEMVAAQQQRPREVSGHRLAGGDAREAMTSFPEPSTAHDHAVERGRALHPPERSTALSRLGSCSVDDGGDASAVESFLIAQQAHSCALAERQPKVEHVHIPRPCDLRDRRVLTFRHPRAPVLDEGPQQVHELEVADLDSLRQPCRAGGKDHVCICALGLERRDGRRRGGRRPLCALIVGTEAMQEGREEAWREHGLTRGALYALFVLKLGQRVLPRSTSIIAHNHLGARRRLREHVGDALRR
mmetsp:Transcript_58955/g.117126  ORF Transcript_58955/g.117126 Transcript_58955/m.117126 type:complete len:362 (-) Transcript_58955:4252-5337(-)